MRDVSHFLPRTTVKEQPHWRLSPGSNRLPTAEELAAVGRREAARVAAERRAAAQVELERAVGRSGIPRRFQGRDFDAYEALLPEQRAALTVCRRYAERFAEAVAEGRCLLLVGGPGTGKTHLACAILATIIRAGHTGLFLSASEALRGIRDAFSPRAQTTESEAFALLTAPDLLVLDEVGVAIGDGEKRTAMLFDVINARYGEQRPMILIANLTAAELELYLGERIMDRLLEASSALVPFTWASHRRAGREV